MNKSARSTSGLLFGLALVWVAHFAPAAAAVPQLLNYQGYLTNTAGQPVTGTVAMVFKLYDAPAAPAALYTETQSTVAVNNGLYSVAIGAVTALTLPFNVPYYLGVKVGADAEMTPRQQLTASPYALSSATAFVQGGNAFGAPAVIGTTDAQPVTVRSGGTAVNLFTARGDGLRFTEGAANGSFGPNTINGNQFNSVSAGISGATIAGGGAEGPIALPPWRNTVSGDFGTVGGGSANVAGSGGTVTGGFSNVASGNYSSVSGGYQNQASGNYSSVAGGGGNFVSATYSSVSGGQANAASGAHSSIAGGYANSAGGAYSSVAGGYGNVASGDVGFVAGGQGNIAYGYNSFAAGSYAIADHSGAFLWADASTATTFATSKNWSPGYGPHTFNVRAVGGVLFATSVNGSGVPATYCYMGNSGTGWICASDRNVKERIDPITPSRVLAGVLAMPVSTWSIIGSKVRQMGPMAQDFYRAFGLGDTDKAINSIDAGGVAFAAIQGLNQKLTHEVAALRARLSGKDEETRKLEARLAAIEKKLALTAIR